MRLPVALCLLVTSTLVAAPQKDDLPAGAIGRLGTAVSPAKDGPRPGEVTALLYLGEHTIFVGTNAGWNTWDLQKRQPRQVRPIGGPTYSVARDAVRIFVGSARKLHAIEPVESAMAEPARSWNSATDTLGTIAVAANGRRVVYADGEQKLAVLDPISGNTTGTVDLPARPIGATLSSSGRILAVATRDGAARVYGLAANGSVESVWFKRVARSDRSAIQFSPDGRLIGVSSAGRVALLESVTGRQMAVLERKFGEGDVRAFAFSGDGRQVAIVTAGPEAVVRVWSVESGTELASFTGHSGDVNAVAFAPDGRTLATGGSDQVVYLWKCPPTPAGAKAMTLADAWESLDALEGVDAYRAMGALLDDPKRSIETIGAGFRGVAAEQAKIKRWVAELAHDEFRVREVARRALVKAGLRAAPTLTDPARKKMDAEGEQRVRLILEAFESQGLRIPESGLYGEPLRQVRAVRILETLGGKEARGVLEEAAKGPVEGRLTKEAKAALEMIPSAK